jgi:stage II sporulation protein D (peptidoglycan lytic transglycosylase)
LILRVFLTKLPTNKDHSLPGLTDSSSPFPVEGNNYMKFKTVLTIAIFCLISSSAAQAANKAGDIRVRIGPRRSAVNITSLGGTLSVLDPVSGIQVRSLKIVNLIAGTRGLEGVMRAPSKKLIIKNTATKYQIGNKLFRGTLNIVWTAPGWLIVVDELPIEDYLIGLLGSELFPNWPSETMKAQSVAARTYAMTRINGARRANPPKEFDIVSSVLAQVYHGAHRENPRLAAAVLATRGEVLKRNGRIFPSYYHSCCGGRTEHASNVWPGSAGPPTVSDKYCATSPRRVWQLKMSVTELSNILSRNGLTEGEISTIATTPMEDSPRVDMLIIEDASGLKMIKATRVRKAVGYEKLRSTWFDIKLTNGTVTFDGRGFGHGVGMCQWGAKGMADAGKNYREILKHYYQDAKITKEY